MKVLISIIGMVMMDGDTDKVELTSVGSMTRTEKGYLLEYEDARDDDSDSTTTTLLRVEPPLITMQRKDDASASLMLEYGKRHQCSYTTPYGNLMMGIYTRQLDNHMTDEGGRLRFRYSMDFGGNTTDHDVRIEVRPIQ